MTVASFLTKIGKMQSAGYRLCKIAREARGESTDGLADETHGHINSAGCERMATTVTAAHHSIWGHLHDSMHAAQKPKSKLKFVMLDKGSNMSTLWRREELLRICSQEELAEKAQDIEVTIPVKESQETQYNLDPGSFFVNRFWGRRPEGVAINEALKMVYILEFKRSTDSDEGFLEVKDAEANEQQKTSSVRSKLLLQSGNLIWWVTADRWLRATSTPSSKSLIHKKEKKTSTSLIM